MFALYFIVEAAPPAFRGFVLEGVGKGRKYPKTIPRLKYKKKPKTNPEPMCWNGELNWLSSIQDLRLEKKSLLLYIKELKF